jgi:hypothetical protein
MGCGTMTHQGMLTGVEPVILASARKHGIADEDMLHAYRNPIRVFDLDDLTLVIGGSRAGEPVEIGVAAAESIDFIVHAMSARPPFLR